MMIRTLVKKLNYNYTVVTLFFLYLGIVYFSFAISNIFLGLGVVVFTWGILFKKIQLNLEKRNWFIYIGVISVFVLTLLSTIGSNNSENGFKYLLLRLPVLITPFIFLFMEVKNKSVKTGLKIFFILTLAAVLKTLYSAFIYRNEGVLFEPDLIFFVTIIQHPYFGVFVLIALVSIIEFKLIKFKPLKISVYILFAIAIGLTTSRLVYILFILIILFYLISRFSKKKRIIIGSVFSVFILIFVFINQRIIEKFQTSIQYENSPRLKLWNNAYKIMETEDKTLFGIGIGDYYQNKKEAYFFEETKKGTLGYNPHSQIVEFFITNGVFGLIVLLTCLCYGINQIKKQNNFAIIIFCIIVTFSFTESILTRQFGVQLYSIFIPLIFTKNFIRKQNGI